MNLKRLGIYVLGMGVIVSLAVFGVTSAQTPKTASDGNNNHPNIQFPVSELGNCASETECRTYCDVPENLDACINFAEKNNLMSKKEIESARKFGKITNGPGGCTTKDSCDTFCGDINNIDECVKFAEENDFVPKKNLEEAKKIQKAIHSGIKPPDCNGKDECDTYCSKPDNIEECVKFGEAAGFLKGQELEDAHKMIMAIHKGIRPPDCNGKDECDTYCGQDSHFDECANFAEAMGLMKPEEAKMIRETRGRGPGGCTTKDSCEAFCDNPENQEECFSFGKEHKLIPEKELNKIEKNHDRFRDSFENTPPEVAGCLQDAIGAKKIEKLKNGTMMPSENIGEKMKKCFQKTMMIREDDHNRECQTPEECRDGSFRDKKIRMENFKDLKHMIPEEFKKFGSPEGFIQNNMMSPEQINKFKEMQQGSFDGNKPLEKFDNVPTQRGPMDNFNNTTGITPPSNNNFDNTTGKIFPPQLPPITEPRPIPQNNFIPSNGTVLPSPLLPPPPTTEPQPIPNTTTPTGGIINELFGTIINPLLNLLR